MSAHLESRGYTKRVNIVGMSLGIISQHWLGQALDFSKGSGLGFNLILPVY